MMEKDDAPASGFWATAHDVYRTLKQARFSILVTLIAIPVFGYVDQGVELVRAMGEGNQYDGRLESGKLCALLCGLLIWSLNNWYWARVTFNMRSPDSVSVDRMRRQPLAWLSEHFPRILGVLPFLIFGTACVKESATYGADALNSPQQRLLVYAGVCLLFSILLYAFFTARRKWLVKSEAKGVRKIDFDRRVLRIRDLSSGTLAATGAMLLVSAVLFVWFLASPVVAPKAMGSAAILAFSAASWVCFGSALIVAGSARRIPVIILLLALALAASFFNDNHAVRVLPQDVAPRLTARDQFIGWEKKLDAEFPDEPNHPMFIVTAAGGGIRAAYWTATVLGTLQQKSVEAQVSAQKAGQKVPPDFASHLFAISGVSGGSLGAAVFAAELAESKSASSLTSSAQGMLGEDFLSPALAAMLNRDWLQRFIPWKINCWDRGRALEAAWEDGWRNQVDPGTNRFAKSLNGLYGSSKLAMPILFLNGTSVEAGRRIISSNVEINRPGSAEDFIDAWDATREAGGKAMRLSTAAHMSARFTYVSPAGLFPDGQHVVDGGYFENSGDTTAWDVLQAVRGAPHDRVTPFLIEISNDPGESDPAVTAGKPGGEFISDVISPLYALLNTRDARGTYSQMLIRESGYPVRRFTLRSSSVPLPLGWMLSGGAAREMRDQIDSANKAKANPDDLALIDEIMNRLAHP